MIYKIKQFRIEKTKYFCDLGQGIENNIFAVRSRKNGDLGEMNLPAMIDYLKSLNRV